MTIQQRGEYNAPPSYSVSVSRYIDSEVLPLKLKKLIHHMNPPCAKCPYKLGLVHTVVNPCPQCKANGYQTFERFQKQALGDSSTSEREKR